MTLDSPRDEFRVGDMGPLYLRAARAATQAGVHLSPATRYVGRTGDGYRLHGYRLLGPDGDRTVRARYLVGADGARSPVARDLGLDRNRHVLVGAEQVFGVPDRGRAPTFHCVVDPALAPGYLAWVVDDGRHAHVGVAGYAHRFPGGLRRTLEEFRAGAPGLDGLAPTEDVERRGGPIPVGGLLRRIAGPDGLLVGDAAGAVSPLTAGGLDPCLRLSAHAADVLDTALRAGRSAALAHYDGRTLRARFRGRLLLRHGLAHVRSPATAEAAFALLRTRAGRAAAAAVLFGDGSFPDPHPPPPTPDTRPDGGSRRSALSDRR